MHHKDKEVLACGLLSRLRPVSFSSDLVRAMHARGSGEAISHARGHLRVSRFAGRTTEKRETAHSLVDYEIIA